MKNDLDDILNHAAKHLPKGWSIEISVEHESASVYAVRPNGTQVDMWEDEIDFHEQFMAAIKFANDEEAAKIYLQENTKDSRDEAQRSRWLLRLVGTINA